MTMNFEKSSKAKEKAWLKRSLYYKHWIIQTRGVSQMSIGFFCCWKCQKPKEVWRILNHIWFSLTNEPWNLDNTKQKVWHNLLYHRLCIIQTHGVSQMFTGENLFCPKGQEPKITLKISKSHLICDDNELWKIKQRKRKSIMLTYVVPQTFHYNDPWSVGENNFVKKPGTKNNFEDF